MTADTKLLPLPEKVEVDKHLPTGVRIYAYDANTLKDYARANVAHATAPLQAEIEALRVEVAAQRTRADAMAGEAFKHEDRAERLAEALRMVAALKERESDELGDAVGIARDALAGEQEVGNGWPC